MASHKKSFRIESMREPRGAIRTVSALEGDPALHRHRELMSELRLLRNQIAPPAPEPPKPADPHRLQHAEVQKLRSELEVIQAAIVKTKHEIATVHLSGFQGPEMARVTHELDAIVDGTEQATQSILNCAEEIDQAANTLSAMVRNDHEKGLAQDVQDRVVQIFEACNFQDITGQRISKVVATLKFIETHIASMMEIWGGVEAFHDARPEAVAEQQGESKMLNGPKLDGEQGHASQDDIDALFA